MWPEDSYGDSLIDERRWNVGNCKRCVNRARRCEQAAKVYAQALLNAREEIISLRKVILELNKIPKPIDYVRNETVYEMGMKLKERFPVPYDGRIGYSIDPEELHGFINRLIKEMVENN